MRSYTFRYKHGQSAPFAHLNAIDDGHFFNTILPLWEKETGFKHLDGTVVCATTGYRKVPEPATAKPAAEPALWGTLTQQDRAQYAEVVTPVL